MTSKITSGSKIPTTGTNTNKKKSEGLSPEDKNFDTSLIKKNEFALIVFGALFLTVIVFFLFFRSSSSSTAEVKIPTVPVAYADLEKRIQMLENSVKSVTSREAPSQAPGKGGDEIRQLTQRVARLEAAFSVKFDSIIDRLAGMEKNIAQLKSTRTAQVKKSAPKKVASKTPVKKPAPATAKKSVKKDSLFHTVQKGETLYSISRKYKTTVASLRKLNNLTEASKIYPGNNILVR